MIQKESPINMEVLCSIEIEDFKKLNPNSFPVWVYPKILQNIIFDAYKSMAYPIDYVSSSILFAAGVANGLSTKIEVKKEWTESSLMFLAIVGPSGITKSHSLGFAMKPIEEHDDKTHVEYESKLREWEMASGEKGPKPYWQKILFMDATIEAICESHSFNKKGLGVYSEELKSWFGNMSRYSNGSDLEQWLSIWSGKKIVIDRKGSRSINLSQSFVSVIGTIQDDILMEITTSRNQSNGFTDRVLFAAPDGLKMEPWSDESISDLTKSNYYKIINFILAKKPKYDDKNRVKSDIIPYTPEAFKIAKKWNEKNTKRANDENAGIERGMYSKMNIYIHRFALILQLLIDACEQTETNEVGIEATNGAVEVVEYFVKQAIKVQFLSSKKSFLEKDKKTKDLFEILPLEFSTSEALEIGNELNIPERTIKRILSKGVFFKRLSQGKYMKL